jgi:hypothetical protein
MIADHTSIRTPTHRVMTGTPRVSPVVGPGEIVECPASRSTGWRSALPVVVKHVATVTTALLSALGSWANPSFFEPGRGGPAEQRLGPGLSRESDSFWPLSQW